MTRCLTIFLLLFLSAIPAVRAQESATQEIQITVDFPSGSLSDWSIHENEIELTHAASSGGIWYYFQIENVLNKTLTFHWREARKEFYDTPSLPAISYDQKHWRWIMDRSIQPHPEESNRLRYSFRHTFARNRAWIAFTPPFPSERIQQLSKEHDSHPHVTVHELCETPLLEQSLPLFHITDPDANEERKKGILILSREDAYDNSSSWIAQGIIRFLLSDDPVAAAIKRRCHILVIPLFDMDGVSLGHAVHPLTQEGKSVFWTETWPETIYSFYEQRSMKVFLQSWKDEGRSLDYVLRLHSESWKHNILRREYAGEEQTDAQDQWFLQTMEATFLPWFRNLDRIPQETRFTHIAGQFFPKVLTGLYVSDYFYEKAFGSPYTLYKNETDLAIEGEMIIRSIGEQIGIKASDPPPYLHAAHIYELVGKSSHAFHASCVYRDLLGRAPEYVRVVVNDTPFELSPAGEGPYDYRQGVLYTGAITVETPENQHYFLTSNQSREARVPQSGSRPGPFLLTNKE